MVKEETYTISGMSCAACSSAVERVTRKLEGVEESNVNLTTGKMTIKYDDEKVSSQLISQKVEKAGFGCDLYQREEEKKEVTLAIKEDDKELKEKKHNLVGAWIFTLALMYVSMGSMLPYPLPLPPVFSGSAHPVNFALIQLLLTIPVLFYGRFFFTNGFSALFHKNPNMNSLVAIGSACSFAYSIVVMFSLDGNPHQIHNLYFESASMVLTFVMTGKYLEARSTKKTKGAITALMKLTPNTAIVVSEGKQKEVPVQQLKVGDIVLVKPGSRIPTDGRVTQGESAVDESMLTGESMPIDKTVGSEVTGGSMNINGALYVSVSRVGKDTTLSQIIAYMEDAQGKKAPIAKIADKVSGVFVPIVMVIAVIAGLIWFFAGQDPSFILKVITSVLVIACPCALGLATPAAIMVGTGKGASLGILIRSGGALEIAGKTQVVVLDKTGTITQGNPQVTTILSKTNNQTEILLIASAAESVAQHPLAQAIEEKAKDSIPQEKMQQYKVEHFTNIPGKGLRATLVSKDDTHAVYIGNTLLMKEEGIAIDPELQKGSELLSAQGNTLVYVAKEKQLLGIIAIADTIRDTSKEAVAMFKKLGVEVQMLTGDNKKTAEYIGGLAGVDKVIAEVLPQEKAQVVAALQAEGKSVMMVGDGINDAPALVQADTGVAIGGGSHIAVEAGNIILMKNDLRDAAKSIQLSRLTLFNIKENLFWAFFYNSIGIPIAAGALYPVFGILLTPMLAGLAMSLSSVFVVGNALRLRTKKIKL